MREILFRGRTANGDWLFGSFVLLYTNQAVIDGDFVDPIDPVDPATVGQFTGLTDKNGVKIFEGDIVKFKEMRNLCPDCKKTETNSNACDWCKNYEIAEATRPIIFSAHNGDTHGLSPRSGFSFPRHIYDGVIEVIGNIYDNPELLKGGDSI